MSLFAASRADACAAYDNLRAAQSEHGAAAREHCDDLWRDFAPLADATFVEEFALHLHERWFEMYLTVTLLRAGMNVQCPKPGPDVLLTVGRNRLWIEATCASPGELDRPDSVPPSVYGREGEPAEMRRVPKDQRVLRIRNSLTTKERVISRYIRAGIVAPTEPIAIAINVHDVPWLWTDMDEYMQRSLYGTGDLVFEIDRRTAKPVGSHRQQVSHVVKHSGAPVGVQPFLDGTMAHVSAVLASGADAGNLRTYLGEDFVLLPNLTALSPWPQGAIPLGDERSFRPTEDGWNGTRIRYPASS